MLQKRVFGSLARYFSLLALIFTSMMLIPGVSEGTFATPSGFAALLSKLFEPLPHLWLTLLPTVFMVSVLLAFSRLSLKGEVKIWRSAGASAWPFVRVTSVFGLALGALMTGLLWPLTQPESGAAGGGSIDSYETRDGTIWMRTQAPLLSDAQTKAQFISVGGQVLQGTLTLPEGTANLANTKPLELRSGWISDGSTIATFERLILDPSSGDTLSPATLAIGQIVNGSATDLAYRLSYPILLIGVGLLILPLALSIDGQRLTLVKITATCLLALNTLFLLLMTDAMAQANLWDGVLFYPLRAIAVLACGLLAILLFEERAA